MHFSQYRSRSEQPNQTSTRYSNTALFFTSSSFNWATLKYTRLETLFNILINYSYWVVEENSLQVSVDMTKCFFFFIVCQRLRSSSKLKVLKTGQENPLITSPNILVGTRGLKLPLAQINYPTYKILSHPKKLHVLLGSTLQWEHWRSVFLLVWVLKWWFVGS